jgi:hypothetical protein
MKSLFAAAIILLSSQSIPVFAFDICEGIIYRSMQTLDSLDLRLDSGNINKATYTEEVRLLNEYTKKKLKKFNCASSDLDAAYADRREQNEGNKAHYSHQTPIANPKIKCCIGYSSSQFFCASSSDGDMAHYYAIKKCYSEGTGTTWESCESKPYSFF